MPMWREKFTIDVVGCKIMIYQFEIACGCECLRLEEKRIPVSCL
jgi:hypothetical protein